LNLVTVYPDPKTEPRRPQSSNGTPFVRSKVTLAQCEDFTRFFYEVFEVFAVQFSSWAKYLLNLPKDRPRAQ
jgi:hypothetical protein